MLVDKIILQNFRIYEGKNELEFTHQPDKNVTIVSGSNGYGKTTLLTSLVWCLYGKLMVDVDERYKREIYESGGYMRYCQKTINRSALGSNLSNQSGVKNAVLLDSTRKVTAKHSEPETFSVTVIISDIFIPSLPCNRVEIKRSYNVRLDKEDLIILVDDRENELTKEVGSEIFINDFILPKEIAKFFFFDAEKIVSLAEIRSADEKRELSRAYSEVLGIRKYEDLKSNLENIRIRLRKQGATDKERKRLKEIDGQVLQKEKLLDHYQERLIEIEEEISRKKQDADRFQEKLIREGSNVTAEELNDLRSLKESTTHEARNARKRLNEMLDLAPFAIAANKFQAVEKQIDLEENGREREISPRHLKTKIKGINEDLDSKLTLPNKDKKIIEDVIKSHLSKTRQQDFKALLDLNNEEVNVFRALRENLFTSYQKRFKDLVNDVKMNQSAYAIILNKLSNAETKESDVVIQEIRKAKNKVELEISQLDQERIDLTAKVITNTNEKNSHLKIQAELNKKISLADVDIKKDETARRLMEELTEFIKRFKDQKKKSLQEKILSELNKLMHKKDFISQVEVIIDGDLIDVEFFDGQGQLINKDGLSKGEQQLYATALLKALVDESNINFPIFIDSPLQKFDRKHARNIVADFYPNVSDQVVLFPLLEKELTEDEFQHLLPRVSRTFLINNKDKDKSTFQEVKPSELFVKSNTSIHV